MLAAESPGPLRSGYDVASRELLIVSKGTSVVLRHTFAVMHGSRARPLLMYKGIQIVLLIGGL